ncbi:hypothetical protein [Citreimonas salinaria]|uniref:Uncharacterized protein n=1 Tax=Citreimonas salinaria TaxID=321339 RepID=A0A1H3KBR6_9RHOB|nr:hypothetical protein [Citreimonas salinaria]SDY49610.1 hypothetical protein SAMN05444340_10943 [Citreimonas salinaria]
MTGLPPFYFRRRPGGAQVFRVTEDPRSRRVEMEPLAVVKTGSGEIRAQGGRVLSDADLDAIRDWMAAEADAVDGPDDVARTVALIGRTAHWAQARADDADLEAVSDALLLAMHDLRAVLVRRKAARLDSKS